ncbi:MAG: hypothetical protein ACFFD8_11260 [Candidatus Thorarchaeota archaeon]
MIQLSITTPPLARLVQKRGYQLDELLKVMQRMMKENLVDGFEFQNLAEWDPAEPPRDKAQFEFRIKSWQICEKHTMIELAEYLQSVRVPILSVHANRDVGINLCSETQQGKRRGEQLINNSLFLAERVNAKVCVFHLWDTWKTNFDLKFLQQTLERIADQYSTVKASVENVPINLSDLTPFEAVKNFDWITLDLRWAAMYNELDKFEQLKKKIVNVHLRGQLEACQWTMYNAPFNFYDALDLIRNKWNYSGLLTLEPERGLKTTEWKDFAAAIKSIH